MFKMKNALLALLPSLIQAHNHASTTITFEEGVATLPKPLSDLSATYDEATDRIYLIGGCDDPQGNSQLTPDLFVCFSTTDMGYSFNPNDGTFEEIPEAPRPRYRHTAANVDGKIWLVGGRTVEDLVIPEVDVYDPVAKEWTTIGSLPAELQFSDQGSFYHKDYMYIVGGYEQNYAAQATTFRISTTSFEDGLSTEVLSPLAQSRGDVSSVIVDDFAYITGGFSHEDDEGGFCVPHTSTERYDVNANEWKTIDDMENGRADKALVALNGHIFALGGESKDKSLCSGNTAEYTMALSDVEVLQDPHLEESAWEHIADTPTQIFRFAGVAYPPTSTIYTFGGQKFYSAACECFATSDAVTKYMEAEVDSSSAFGLNYLNSFTFVMGVFALLNGF